jgi:hypothetical protein
VTPMHDPMPSHPAEVSTVPTHRLAPHEVPRLGKLQAPPPLQVPPHDPVPKHSSSGSCPPGQKVQRPSDPVMPHDSHDPVHAESQQTPSTQ